MQALWTILWAHPSVYAPIVLNFHLDTCFTHGKYRKNAEWNGGIIYSFSYPSQ